MAVDVTAEIRAEMARRRVTITTLADEIGMSRAALARKLRGDRPVTLHEAERIAAALGTPLSTITRRAEGPAA